MKRNFTHRPLRWACCAMAGLAIVQASYAALTGPNDKFLGNVIANTIPASFSSYWDQVTPENAGKWGSVEAQRDQMNWQGLDQAYQFAQQHQFPFKEHTFVWGSQYPQWIDSLSAEQQRAEVVEWMQAYCQRYPDTAFIDVVNEPLHTPATYRQALGGAG